MTELLLNAILNLFALSAARLPASARAKVGAALERYLRRHLRLAQPQVYLELFATALELHQEREPAALLAQAASAAGQEAYACPHRGQVNPERLFEIIEERAVDDQGRYTDQLLRPPAGRRLRGATGRVPHARPCP